MRVLNEKILKLYFEYITDMTPHERAIKSERIRQGREYEFISLKFLAEKYSYSYGYIRKLSCIGKWKDDKKAFAYEVALQVRKRMIKKHPWIIRR
jgi:hypothetical protein